MAIINSVLAAAVAVSAPAQAGDLGGVWEGRITVAGQSIRIVFRVGADGTAVMDSPDQGALGIPVQGPTVEGGVTRFVVPAIGGRFEGARSEDGRTLTGSLSQGGVTLPLVLARTAETASTAAPARPQTPRPPFPYRSEDVAFENAPAGVRLAGTLTRPEGAGPFPAAILITGSGPQDRDETILDHKPFLVWADALTRRGIAVLRYDDRGVGASTGDFAASTSDDFAGDARAALDWLAKQPGIDPTRIGLIGHSEGGTIAPLVVQEGGQAAWIVMLAGPAVPGGELLTEQLRRFQLAGGVPASVVEANVAVQARIMTIITAHATDADAATGAVRAMLTQEGLPQALIDQAVAQVRPPWMRWFVAHDPAPALEAARVPILALYGGKDLNVPADQNAPALARLRPDAEIVTLPGLNHLMQEAGTGLPSEYGTIEQTLAPEAIRTVVDWVAARSGVR